MTLPSLFDALLRPEKRAELLVRRCSSARRFFYPFWRQLLLTLYGCDVGLGAEIRSGLRLPHPVGIVIGQGSVILEDVTIYQNVTIGQRSGAYPRLDRDVTVFPNACVLGGVVVGRGAIIGAGQIVTHDVSAGATVGFVRRI